MRKAHAVPPRLLHDPPDTVVGIEATGRVEACDNANVLDPIVEAAPQRNERIRLLYVIGEDSEGYSPGTAREDTQAGHRTMGRVGEDRHRHR